MLLRRGDIIRSKAALTTRFPSLDQALRSDFIRQSGLVFAATMVFNAASYAFHLGVSRLLGVAHYGELLALISILYIFGAAGTIANNIVAKLSAGYYALGNAAQLRALTRLCVRDSVAVVALVTLAGSLLTPLVAAYLHLENRSAVAWTAFALGLGIALPAIRGLLQGAHRFRAYGVTFIIEGVGRLGFGVPLVLAGYDVSGAVAAFGLAALVAFGYAAVAVRDIGRDEELRHPLDLRPIVALIGGVSLATLEVALLTSTDVLLVRHLFSEHDAGIFAITSVAGKALLFTVSFVPMLILPRAAAAVAAGRPSSLMLAGAAALTFVPGLLGVAVFDLASGPIVRVFGGARFAEASSLLALYGLATVFLSGINLCVAYNVALHRFRFVIPLGAVALGEIVAIDRYHPTLASVVWVLTAANALALLVTVAGSTRGTAGVR